MVTIMPVGKTNVPILINTDPSEEKVDLSKYDCDCHPIKNSKSLVCHCEPIKEITKTNEGDVNAVWTVIITLLTVTVTVLILFFVVLKQYHEK